MTPHEATAEHVRGCLLCRELDEVVGILRRDAKAIEGRHRRGTLERGAVTVGALILEGAGSSGAGSSGEPDIPGRPRLMGRPISRPDVQRLEQAE